MEWKFWQMAQGKMLEDWRVKGTGPCDPQTEFHIVDVATDESVDIFKIENGNIKK